MLRIVNAVLYAVTLVNTSSNQMIDTLHFEILFVVMISLKLQEVSTCRQKMVSIKSGQNLLRTKLFS